MAKNKNAEKHGLKISLKIKFSMAMILLTVAVVLSISYFFAKDEIKIMTRAIEDYASREVWHLSSIAQDALSTENDLAIGFAVDNVMKEGAMKDSIRYIHVIAPDGVVIKSSDAALNGTKLDDKISLEALAYSDAVRVRKLTLPDQLDGKGTVFDFTKPVFHRTNQNLRLATIRLGFSDLSIRQQIKRIYSLSLYISAAFITVSIIFAFVLAQITTRPLKILSNGVSIIGKGNLDHKINVKTRDEIGQLAREFNVMTHEIKNSKHREIESALMQEQLDVAKEIQEGLNPMAFYSKRGVEIKGYTRAAKGVGGDYFDYKDIDDSRVGTLISDVSGKGIPASLVMVMIRTVFVSALLQQKKIQCAKIVNAINKSLSSDFAIDKFATLLFVIFDRDSGMMEFSNAGHGPVFCYRAAKKMCSVTKLDGVPIGITEDSEYIQGKIPFEVGDIMIMYTDGITEMRNSEKEEYGRTRLQNLVVKNAHLNAEDLNKTIVDDVDKFRGNVPPHDDMTVLVMKRIS